MSTVEEYLKLQNISIEPFLKDLIGLCCGAFGTDWTEKSADETSMEKLRQYKFLPDAFSPSIKPLEVKTECSHKVFCQ